MIPKFVPIASFKQDGLKFIWSGISFLYDSARQHFADGSLFRSAREGKNIVPEFPPDGEPALVVPAHVDPAVEIDDEWHSHHEDVALLDAALHESEEEAKEEFKEPEEEVGSADVGMLEALPPDVAELETQEVVLPPPVAERPKLSCGDLTVLERCTALNLIFGKGPKSAR